MSHLLTLKRQRRGADLLRDLFTTDRAAGEVNDTAADGGPGLRHAVETDGTIITAGGILTFSGQSTVTYGDLGLYYDLPFSRATGRTVEFVVRRNGIGVCAGLGFFVDTTLTTASRVHCFQLSGTGVDTRGVGNFTGVASITSTSVWTRLKIVLAATGATYYVNDKLVATDTTGVQSPLYIGITDGDMNLSIDRITVYGGPDLGCAVLTFDDSIANIYSGFAYAAARGVLATVYCITDRIDTNPPTLTSVQLLAMDAAGWAIGNHTRSHPALNTLTEAQQIDEIAGATAALDAFGLPRASRHVAYPTGSYDATTLAVMASTGMLSGRRVGVAATATLSSPIYEIPVAYGTVITGTTVLQLQNAIRTGIAGGGWPFLLFHQLADVPSVGEWSNANFNALIDWIIAAGVRTRTILTYVEAHG